MPTGPTSITSRRERASRCSCSTTPWSRPIRPGRLLRLPTPRFWEHFRVIAPDTRGSGKSVHPGGPITAALLADDVAALIQALNLDRPLICGFSDGGETATLVGIRHPGSVRAIVNHGGYDLFNPDPHAPAIAMPRQMLGGTPR